MNADATRLAAQFVAFANGLRQPGTGNSGAARGPVLWHDVKHDEAMGEWDDLRRWVERLRRRFPNAVRLPDCWWRHNDLVEVLSALRDYERACYTPSAPGTAAVDWHRALRDMEMRMEIWIKRFGCSVSGRGHDPPEPTDDAAPPGWDEFVAQDIRRRERSASGAASPDAGAQPDT